MFPPSQEPAPPLTAAHVKAWMEAAALKRLQLHLHETESPYSLEREQAFLEMGALCEEAIEAVCVLATQLWQESAATPLRAADMLAFSSHLWARYPPSTESQLLHIFKGEKRPRASHYGRQ